MAPRLKVLVCAYACSPREGSEPGVGWGFVHELAKLHDLWVLVEEQFRADIEQHLEAHPELRASMRFVFLGRRSHPRLRRLWPPSYYWFHRAWHRRAFRVAARLHAEVGFDLAHQLTIVAFREPGYLWRLPIPFVWGPVGGFGTVPWRFLPELGPHGAAYFAGFNVLNGMHARVLRRPRAAARAAAAGLVAATREGRDAFRRWGCDATVLAEVGLAAPPAQRSSRRAPGSPLSLVWSGEHVPRKALNLGLEALAAVGRDVEWSLEVLGDGPETARWKRDAARLGVAERCRFRGRVDRARALEIMASSHLLLVTSMRDLTSTVIVEALALGLPIVCPDHCGFADAVDETCGVKVPVTSPRVLIAGVAAAVEALARDEPRRAALAHGALTRARAFDWPAKAAQIDALYRRVTRAQQESAGIAAR